jgi:hypothetical protein
MKDVQKNTDIPHSRLRINVYHTADYQDIANQYYQGQLDVLEEFGVEGIASLNPSGEKALPRICFWYKT